MGSGGSRKKRCNVPTITTRDKSILELKVQRDRLQTYQKRIAVVLERETEAAREQLALGSRDRALLALRRKKYQQGLLDKTHAQLLNLEQLTQQIEFALVEQQVLQGLQAGNAILKEIQSEMLPLEKIDELMADTAEAVAYQEEVSRMLSGRIADEDEDAVEAELAALQADLLPSVPLVQARKGVAAVAAVAAEIGDTEEEGEEQPHAQLVAEQ